MQLVNLLLFSDKRKNFLLLLAEGPKSIGEALIELQVPRISFLPQVKKLKEEGIIVQDGDMYRLSLIGEILVNKARPLVDAAGVFESDEFFWSQRKLDVVPFHLLKRIGELKGCCPVEPGITHGFDSFPDIVENFSEPAEVMMLFSYFHPHIPSFLLSVAKKGVELKLVFLRVVFERFAKDFHNEAEQILKQENSSVFVLDASAQETPALIAVSDHTLILGLFNKKGRFDGQYLKGSEPSALYWGKELFDHYMGEATEISSM
ncbi:winged helix-turn-helix domain-containing protein [Methanosarcina sp. KYL-1]|nr:winged helix-turn-helix domain-containing protein [Methanosarcina sp. KYL-1]